MTPQDIQRLTDCRFDELTTLFPDHSMDELRRLRVKEQNRRGRKNEGRGDPFFDARQSRRKAAKASDAYTEALLAMLP